MPKYTSEGNIEKYLGVDISGLAAWVESICNAVDNWIENYTGKEFDNTNAGSARYFDGNGQAEIIIDSFNGSPTVLILDVDGSTLYTLTEGAAEDYIVYPLNTTEKDRLTVSDTSQISAWPTGKGNIKVTANWGVAASVPADIELAATMLASQFVQNAIKGGRDISAARLGELQINFRKIDEEAEAMGIYNILDKYREIEI